MLISYKVEPRENVKFFSWVSKIVFVIDQNKSNHFKPTTDCNRGQPLTYLMTNEERSQCLTYGVLLTVDHILADFQTFQEAKTTRVMSGNIAETLSLDLLLVYTKQLLSFSKIIQIYILTIHYAFTLFIHSYKIHIINNRNCDTIITLQLFYYILIM